MKKNLLLSSDTYLLTESGFKSIDSIVKGEKVYYINSDNELNKSKFTKELHVDSQYNLSDYLTYMLSTNVNLKKDEIPLYSYPMKPNVNLNPMILTSIANITKEVPIVSLLWFAIFLRCNNCVSIIEVDGLRYIKLLYSSNGDQNKRNYYISNVFITELGYNYTDNLEPDFTISNNYVIIKNQTIVNFVINYKHYLFEEYTYLIPRVVSLLEKHGVLYLNTKYGYLQQFVNAGKASASTAKFLSYIYTIAGKRNKIRELPSGDFVIICHNDESSTHYKSKPITSANMVKVKGIQNLKGLIVQYSINNKEFITEILDIPKLESMLTKSYKKLNG